MEDDAEQSVTDRRRTDARTLLGVDARGDEGLDRASGIDDRQRAIPRPDQRPRPLDDFVQHDIEGQLGGNVQPGAMQRQQFFVVPFQTVLHPFDGAHHVDAHDHQRAGGKTIEQDAASHRRLPDRRHPRKLQQRHDDDRRGDRQPAQLSQSHFQPILRERLSRKGSGVDHSWRQT